MPDPKAMSGMPLPVPDMPVGTVTARVIRGALTESLPGQTVELTGAGAPKTAKTDDGRARHVQRSGAGQRASRPSVVVDGERVESQEFAVPAAGGTRLMLVATDAGDREEGRRGSQARARARRCRAPSCSGDQSRFVIEVGDDALNVFNILQIVNTAKRPVHDRRPARVRAAGRAPAGAGMLEGSTPNAVAAGEARDRHRSVRSGQHARAVRAIRCRSAAKRSRWRRRCPAQMTQVAVVAQKIGGDAAVLAADHRAARDGRPTARTTSSGRAAPCGPATR